MLTFGVSSGRRNGHCRQICHVNNLLHLYIAKSLRANIEVPKLLVEDEARIRLWNCGTPRKQRSSSESRQSWQARASPCTESRSRRGAFTDGRQLTFCLTIFTTTSESERSVLAFTSYLL